MKIHKWLAYALGATVFGGVWGALIEFPEKAGFPATLGYVVWSITMLFPAYFSLRKEGWKIAFDKRSVIYGLIIGLFGAGGQLILFIALRSGPAYLVFPLISLAPVVTILLSVLILKERTSIFGWLGIMLAMLAIPLLSYQPSEDSGLTIGGWLALSSLVFLAWGGQGFFMKVANRTMTAASIFFYMTISAIMLVPFAIILTDFSQPVNYSFHGMGLAFLIHIINAVNALFIVNAFRYGKAIIVSPLTNAAPPIITIVLSLIIYSTIPSPLVMGGMVMAVIATLLLSFSDKS